MFSEDYLPVYLINLLPLIGRISYGRKDIDDNHTNSGMKIFFALKFNKALCRRYYNLVSKFFRLRLFTLFQFSFCLGSQEIETNENFQRDFLLSSEVSALNEDIKKVIFCP